MTILPHRFPARAFRLVAALGIAAALLQAATATPARAHTVSHAPSVADVTIEQHLGAAVPLDLPFTDSGGGPMMLGAAMAGKPTILVIVYYKCTMLCPLLLDGVLRGLKPVSFSAGREFSVVVVSVNPRETPEMAAAKKMETLQRYSRPGAAEGWRFLTGDTRSIRALTDAVGYRYTYDAEHDEYAHPAGLVLLTPQGKIARYFYGIEFSPRDLRLGLVEAAGERIGTPVDQVLLLCYHYDPLTGKYGLVIMNVVRLAGAATVLGLGAFMLVALRRERAGRPPAAQR